MENAARIAMTTAVSFEWLMTGRGQMAYASNILGSEEAVAVLLNYSAQSEIEERALFAMRKLDTLALLPIIEMMEGLANPRPIKLNRPTAYCR